MYSRNTWPDRSRFRTLRFGVELLIMLLPFFRRTGCSQSLPAGCSLRGGCRTPKPSWGLLPRKTKSSLQSPFSPRLRLVSGANMCSKHKTKHLFYSCGKAVSWLCVLCFESPQIDDALSAGTKKHSILVIFQSCNVFSVTLLCAFLWYVSDFLTKTANVTPTAIKTNSPLHRIDFVSTVILGSAAVSQFWASPQVRHHHQLLRFVTQHRKPPRWPVLKQLPVSFDRGASLHHRLVPAAVLFQTLLPIFHTLSRGHPDPLCPSHPNR